MSNCQFQGVGMSIDPSERAALFAALRARILKEKAILNHRLNAGEITNVEFGNHVNQLLQRAMRESEGILEESEFVDLFGALPGSRPVLLDPRVSAKEDKGQ